MLPISIRKLTDFRYQILYSDMPDFRLVVDFQPLVEALGLNDNYCLLHWQARPRGERRWGCFVCQDGKMTYRSFAAYASDCPCEGFQLDELGVATVPTAVILYRDSRLLWERGKALIVKHDFG